MSSPIRDQRLHLVLLKEMNLSSMAGFQLINRLPLGRVGQLQDLILQADKKGLTDLNCDKPLRRLPKRLRKDMDAL